jgi:hypothetical protein
VSYPRALLVIALLALGACTDRVTDPAVDPGGKTDPEPKPAPIPLGVYEVVLTGLDGSDGANLSKAVAVPAGPSDALNPVATGITLEQVSFSSFTEGARGQGGHRYISVTFRVRNATGSAVSNLTYIPVMRATTIAGTPFSSLVLFNGSTASASIAQNMVPTGAAFLGEDLSLRTRYIDVLQAFTEAEVAAIALPAGVTGIFPYGFVVSNPTSTTNRTLPNATDPNEYSGMVTFAFRFPLQASANADPFTVAFQVLAVQDTETRITESMEEGQDTSAVRRIRERATSLGATTTTVLNGSTAAAPEIADYPGQRQLCSVRTAGTAASPTRFINNPAAYTQLAVLYSGENMNACNAYFRGGTANRPATNVPFNVTLKAVDHYGNVITTAVDTVVLQQQSGPPVTLTPRAALVGGERGLQVTYADYGTSALQGVGRRNRGSRGLLVAGVTRTWTAGPLGTSTDWHIGANWSPAAAPMSLDSVVVPAAAPVDPVLAANVSILGVTVEDGATISLNAFDLTAGGNVFTGLTGGITNTTGRLVLTGTAKTIQGRVPRLRVSGTYSLTGNLTARAPIQVDAGRLTAGTYRLQAESN